MGIKEQIDKIKAPTICVTVPLAEREKELSLINYAKLSLAGKELTRYDIMALLDSYKDSDADCDHNCITCKYFKACDHYLGMMEAFDD